MSLDDYQYLPEPSLPDCRTKPNPYNEYREDCGLCDACDERAAFRRALCDEPIYRHDLAHCIYCGAADEYVCTCDHRNDMWPELRRDTEIPF